MRIIVGCFLFTLSLMGIFIAIIMEGGHLRSLYHDLPLLLIFPLLIFGNLLASYPIEQHRRAWKSSLSSFKDTELGLQVSENYFKSLGNSALNLGLIIAILGLIHLMENLDKKVMIGPVLSWSLLPILYGVIIKTILAPMLQNSITLKRV